MSSKERGESGAAMWFLEKLGLNREVVGAYMDTFDRIAADQKAVIYGGVLQNGAPFDGLASLEARLDRIEKLLEALATKKGEP